MDAGSRSDMVMGKVLERQPTGRIHGETTGKNKKLRLESPIFQEFFGVGALVHIKVDNCGCANLPCLGANSARKLV